MLVVVAVLLAGCPTGGDDSDVDGGVDSTGLTITWATTTAVPGPVAADRTVQELHITYSSVQVVGDAAPGDDRTTRRTTELEWDADGAPPPTEFPEAPPGLYSRLELGVGGSAETIEIDGEVDLGGIWTPFEIRDEYPNPVSLPLAVDLRPGMVTTLPLEIDVGAVLAVVPFADLPRRDDHLELGRDDPRMVGVRAALVAAIRVAGPPED
jgi:hypothetical protein